jgi:hypothetical protein
MATTAPVFDTVAPRTLTSAIASAARWSGVAVREAASIDPCPLMTVVITWSMIMTGVIVKGSRVIGDGWVCS